MDVDIIEANLIKFKPKYQNKKRICDAYNCFYVGSMKRYYNDLNYHILYCDQHMNNPCNFLETYPSFSKPNYALIDNKDNFLCGYVGCHIHENLIKIYGDIFCKDHAKQLTVLKFQYINKNEPIGMFFNQLEEFMSRKILYHKNIENTRIKYLFGKSILNTKYKYLVPKFITDKQVVQNPPLFTNHALNIEFFVPVRKGTSSQPALE